MFARPGKLEIGQIRSTRLRSGMKPGETMQSFTGAALSPLLSGTFSQFLVGRELSISPPPDHPQRPLSSNYPTGGHFQTVPFFSQTIE